METPRMDDEALDTPADHAAVRCAQGLLADLKLDSEQFRSRGGHGLNNSGTLIRAALRMREISPSNAKA